MEKHNTVFTFLGTTLDGGKDDTRWERWRPNVGLAAQPNLPVHQVVLFYERAWRDLARTVADDIVELSPGTTVVPTLMNVLNPWDLQEVYGKMLTYFSDFPFDTTKNDYYASISTGTHIMQICMFMFVESRRLPGKLIQLSPERDRHAPLGKRIAGTSMVIDLDLARYDAIARRFAEERLDRVARLKSGIPTINPAYNAMVERIDDIASRTRAPILLMGPTGSGKSQLASRLHQLRNGQDTRAPFVAVNCATLHGDSAMSALFGHVKGAYTGATTSRDGYMATANGGTLFLDEIGELGLDEQAALLQAIEDGTFYPVGSDALRQSSFVLITGTNRDLRHDVRVGRFRADLLARINLWTFTLPGLVDRRDDIKPNIDYELDRVATELGVRAHFTREALHDYLAFAMSSEAPWHGNFRDLHNSVFRMVTTSVAGRISQDTVALEIERLRADWRSDGSEVQRDTNEDLLRTVLSDQRFDMIDPFDRVQLGYVVGVCSAARTLSEAGRQLFSVSRTERQSTNDADRLRKYLARFDLTFQDIKHNV